MLALGSRAKKLHLSQLGLKGLSSHKSRTQHSVQRDLIPPFKMIPLFGNYPYYRKVLTPSQTPLGIYLRNPVNCVNIAFL